MRTIKTKMIVYTVLMTTLIAGYWIFELNTSKLFNSQLLGANIAEAMKTGILLLNAIILAYCVWCIRKSIKQLHNVFPNESFIRVHLINSFVYATLYLIFAAISIAETKINIQFNNEETPTVETYLKMMKIFFFYDFVFILIIIFSIYMDLFLLYLILRFTKASLQATGKDLVLEREVPSILFIQNQQLIRETYKNKLTLESDHLEKMREIAEVNEFLYYKLREEGLTSQIDEDIGIEFLNLDRILMRNKSIETHDKISKHSTPT